jgi:alginate O-acetyltransferase complex protein AlgI
VIKVKEIPVGEKLIDLLEPLVLAGLLLLVTAYLVDGSFNPFLYFRF